MGVNTYLSDEQYVPYVKAISSFFKEYSRTKHSSGAKGPLHSTIESYVKNIIPNFNQGSFEMTILEMENKGILHTRDLKKSQRNRHYEFSGLPKTFH